MSMLLRKPARSHKVNNLLLVSNALYYAEIGQLKVFTSLTEVTELANSNQFTLILWRVLTLVNQYNIVDDIIHISSI